MNEEIQSWQREAGSLFQWLVRLYDQSQLLWDDPQAYFREGGWEILKGAGWGGTAMSNWNLDMWPFIYLKAFAAQPGTASMERRANRAAFFGMIFHDGAHRVGPHCFGAIARWQNEDVKCDHWMLYRALGGLLDNPTQAFTISQGPVRCARPPAGDSRYVGIVEVRWFDVPLAAVNSPEALRNLVSALKSLHAGDESPAASLGRGPLVPQTPEVSL